LTIRHVAVLAVPATGAEPPGIDPGDFRLAMLEDAYEVAASLDLVTPALIHAPGESGLEAITWPGTPIVPATTLTEAFEALHGLGGGQAVILAGDAPDLPGLLIGKLFRALSHAAAAVCPSDGGGLVALAADLPLPAWLSAELSAELSDGILDDPEVLTRLRAAAPRPGLVPRAPGWHRLRTPEDLKYLDPRLEGWENTRALLSGHPLNR
jgi:hypothetical protein